MNKTLMSPDDFRDDDLLIFEAEGALPLPEFSRTGRLTHNGASIWYGVAGEGKPVVLLHGGLGHAGNWGYQLPDLLAEGYQVILIDSRGHGRSTSNNQPYTYELMAGDVLVVLDDLGVGKAAMVGWSDGAVIALLLGMQVPERVAGVFFFGCAMDPSGLIHEINYTTPLQHCFARHGKDYAALSATPDGFDAFVEAVSQMQKTQPDVSAQTLARVQVPVAVVQSEFDEFILREHARYLAATIPGAQFHSLDGVSHFAPLQCPAQFNTLLLSVLHDFWK